MYSLYLSVSLATLVSASPFKTTNTCADFTAGACDLSETNIVDHNRFTDTPEEWAGQVGPSRGQSAAHQPDREGIRPITNTNQTEKESVLLLLLTVHQPDGE